MFQFPGFAFVPYVFRNKYLLVISAIANVPTPLRAQVQKTQASNQIKTLAITEIEGGFPHSEIHGSKPVRGSP